MRTRFAPSPTGYLHIGGVRTALFNWLLARRHGGQFVLRIDDTDAERNRPEALQPILDGFRWLGMEWDEGPDVGGPNGPYYQSQRSQLYIDAAHRLLDSGHAYPSYETKEELDVQRKAAEAEKRNFVFRGKHRETSAKECRALFEENPTILRLKVPEGRTICIDDQIRGRVEWQSDLIGDPVILRADARPLYNFATVVDDVGMKISNVVRAAEHLTNTAVQVLVCEALDYPVPQFAHVPVVNEPNSKKKLSKRKMQQFMTPEVIAKLRAINAVPEDANDEEIKMREDLNPATVAFYEVMGYLPAAVVNYLGRLGWSLDDKTEFIPLDQMIANFGLDRVNDAPASFDPQKFLWLAGEYMNQVPVDEKVDGVVPYLLRAGLVNEPIDDGTRNKIKQIVAAAGERLKIFSDLLEHAPPFFTKDPNYEAKAVDKKLKKEGAAELLRGYRELLTTANPFDTQNLEHLLATHCEAQGAKKNLLVHALRVAVTGKEVGLGLYETIVILGREETIRRIDLALQLIGL